MTITLKHLKKLDKETGRLKPVTLYLDGFLKSALDTLIYNIKNDWDFVIVITGDRSVRTGKSVFGMTIGSYLADELNTPFSIDNIFFDSQSMIDNAQKMPKNSVLIYDEGRESLASSKTMKSIQQDILDYFAECGQLNHIFIIILSDFFILKEDIAVARSEMLLNVYRRETKVLLGEEKKAILRFERGGFELFNRYSKQKLYDISKSTRRRNYNLVKANTIGKFTNNYGAVDEKKYRKKKKESLSRFNEKKKAELEAKLSKPNVFRNKVIMNLHKDGLSSRKIEAKLKLDYDFDISDRYIRRIIQANDENEY